MAPFAKPESVLRRADELIAVGQHAAALEALHDVIISKRSRSVPLVSLEPIMLKFVELCVSLRKGKIAKEGLHQYKNISQNTSIATIELVIRKFIQLSEEKVQEAQAKADQITLDGLDDLEATETPESILLSTVSGEQNKDRTDRAVVTPWLKFLWEAYRTTEFRRLCDLLRNHLQNIAKYAHQPHSINLNEPESLQRHLDTRFQQLNGAAELELWQEAFRSVEDIHNLMTMSKKMPKPFMMANYYEKLTKIFMVSDNYLFHAAAWNKYYTLVKTQNKSVTDEEQTRMASLALLSALAIPVVSSKDSGYEVDESKNKSHRLAALLGLNRSPNRAGLLKEALSKNILKHVRPELRELYNILEVQFHPLSICKKIEPIMTKLAEDPELVKYVKPLHQVILTRLFQQLSQVYTTVKLDFVIELASFAAPFKYDSATIEKFIMQGCKKGELSIRIDHATQSLTFETDLFAVDNKTVTDGPVLQSLPADLMRTQLTRLATCLNTTVTMISPEILEAKKEAKKAAFMKALVGMKEEHKLALERKAIIERKKELIETMLARKEKEEAREKALRIQAEQEALKVRLAEERRKREEDRIRAEQEAIRKTESLKLAESLKNKVGVELNDEDLDNLDKDKLVAIQIKQLEKEKSEMATRTKAIGKRLDHVERAMRLEERPLLAKDYERQQRADRVYHDAAVKAHHDAAAAKHAHELMLKIRMVKIVDDYRRTRQEMEERREEEFAQRREAARVRIEEEKARRIQQYRERKAENEARKIREEKELAEREAETARRAEEEEKRRVERAAQAAKERDEYEEKRQQLDLMAAKQREKEAAIEARLSGSRTGSAAPVTPPRWRERVAAKEAAAAAGEAPAPAPAAPTGAYRPPGVRTSEPVRAPEPVRREPPRREPAPREEEQPSARPRFVAPAPAAAGGGGGWREREAAKKAAGHNAKGRRLFITLPKLPQLPNLLKPLSSSRYYKDRTLLKYSQQEFYDLVANVDDYHKFLPWCTYSKMSSPLPLGSESGTKSGSGRAGSDVGVVKGGGEVTVRHGELGIGFNSLQERYVSTVTSQEPWMVRAVSYDSKLFKELSTTWRFTPNAPKTTTLEATMDQEVQETQLLTRPAAISDEDEMEAVTPESAASSSGATTDKPSTPTEAAPTATIAAPMKRQAPRHYFTAAAVFGEAALPRPKTNQTITPSSIAGNLIRSNNDDSSTNVITSIIAPKTSHSSTDSIPLKPGDYEAKRLPLMLD
ncbi:eukaryotic translation initiation factor 3 subunit A [Mortierella sp. AD032]|nr:eukaryotic translation initiation factor 3 subunit A [Mortierella sp. AD032]